MNSSAAANRPFSMVGMTRRVVQVGGALAAVGLILTLMIPILNMNSNDCGSLNCGLVQTIGKAAASVGIALVFATTALAALRTRNFSGAALAALIAFPAAVLAFGVVIQWQQLQAGSDRITPMLSNAREFAAVHRQTLPINIKPLLVTGKGDWAVVRISEAEQTDEFVLLMRKGTEWEPRAIGRAFTREELTRLNAPTDLMRDAGAASGR